MKRRRSEIVLHVATVWVLLKGGDQWIFIARLGVIYFRTMIFNVELGVCDMVLKQYHHISGNFCHTDIINDNKILIIYLFIFLSSHDISIMSTRKKILNLHLLKT